MSEVPLYPIWSACPHASPGTAPSISGAELFDDSYLSYLTILILQYSGGMKLKVAAENPMPVLENSGDRA